MLSRVTKWLRNKLARTQGVGSAKLAKLITGISGSGTGGMADIIPFISATSIPLAGNNVEAARGVAVSYATADSIHGYKAAAVYDAVTFPQFFASEGFQDLRALIATKLLQSAFIEEEKAILLGRDSTLAAPGTPTGTARATVAGETGIVGTGAGGTNVRAKITAVGAWGESAPSAVQTAGINIAQSSTNVIDVTWTDVTGALAYNVYANVVDANAADGGDGARYFYGTSGYNTFTIGVTGRVSTGNTVPTVDTGTGSANAYRGFIQSVESGQASGTSVTGYVSRINAKLSGAAVSQFQAAFASLWNSQKADPDEVWVNGRERRNISDLLQTGAAQPYRLAYAPEEQNRVIAGVVVPEVLNEITGKSVKLTVHPWLPVGNAAIMSYTLPFPTAYGNTTAMEISNVQDYMQIAWPMTSLRYENTIFWFGSLVIYAPSFQGIIHGIAQETAAATGSLQ